MTLSIERLARLETLFCVLINKESAAIIAALTALAFHAHANEEQPFTIAWSALEKQFGMPRDYLRHDLAQTDRAMLTTCGFSLFDLRSRDMFHLEGAALLQETSLPDFSAQFAAVLSGSAAPKLWPRPKDCPSMPSLDQASRSSLALVHTIASHGGAPLLYLQSETDAQMAQQELACLADALTRANLNLPIFIVTDLPHWMRLELLPALLACALHGPDRAIIIAPDPGQFAAEASAWSELDSDQGVPVKRPRLILSDLAEKIARILPHLSQTILMAVPKSGTLPPAVASAFAGAIGPFAFDRQDAVRQLMMGANRKPLSSDTAHLLCDTFGEALVPETLLQIAERLTQALKNESFGFDGMTRRLLESMAPAVASRTVSEHRQKKLENYDPDLFVSDPDVAPYLARADRLREAGIKILAAGPSGSGKTAFASELAQRMGLPLREIRGSDIFAKSWGATERLIKQTFSEALAEKVVLFIDEADAILSDRSHDDANRHLVTTSTSEFLKYIDTHPLPMIAATNFLDRIDKAIIRRFDLVLHAQPLPEEREIIAWRKILKLEPPASFQPLGNTVIADYQLTKRRLDLFGEQSGERAAAVLREVVSAREGPEKPDYGFLIGAH